MKPLRVVLLVCLLSTAAFAQTAAVNGFCTTGGVKVTTQGMNSTTTVLASYPQCTVTVYLTGTLTLANLTTSTGGSMANPFTANRDASWQFYATAGAGLDVVMSGGIPNSFSQPVTLTDLIPVGTSGGGGGGGNVIQAPQAQIAGYPLAGVNATVGPNPTGGLLNYVTPILQGTGNIDQFDSGSGNNGIPRFLASSGCGSACVGALPPTSTDTELAQPVPSTNASLSSLIYDYRGNVIGLNFMNPQAVNNINSTGAAQAGPGVQIAMPTAIIFNLANPGPTQGGFQVAHSEYNRFIGPGFSNNNLPQYFPPLAGYTTNNPWAEVIEHLNTSIWNTSGITGGGAFLARKYAIGDHQTNPGYFYSGSSNGCVSPGDECFYPHGGSQAFTNPNYISTLASTPDNYHWITTPSNGYETGDGLYLIDASNPIMSQGYMGSITTATTSAYGTITFPNTTVPASTAIGTMANDCVVPTQQGGVGTATCVVNVTSGSFGPTSSNGILAGAYFEGNLHDVSSQVTAATALSAGKQTLTLTLVRTLPAGSFVFQGGVAGSVVCLHADSTFLGDQSNSQEIYGSCYPTIGSPDAHTVAYAVYNASQIWATLPLPGSQATTMATTGNGQGGFTLMNLSRDSAGNVTGTFQNNSGRIPIMNGAIFFTIANSTGCTNGVFDSIATNNNHAAYLSPSDPTGQTLIMPTPITGLPGTCTSALVFNQGILADMYWAAEVTNVSDPNNPSGGFDGYIATTFQNNFHVGDTLKGPPNGTAGVVGQADLVNMATPFVSMVGKRLQLGTYSALGGVGYQFINAPIPQFQIGYQGVQQPSDALEFSNIWGNIINIDQTPSSGNAVVKIGFPNTACAGITGHNNCNLFQNYDLFNIQNGTWREHWDFPTQTMSYYNFNSQLNGLPNYSFSPTLITDNIPHSFISAEFQGNDAGTFVTEAQLHTSNLYPNTTTPLPVSYDLVLAAPTAVSSTVPPGGTTNDYIFAVQGPGGTSFSPLVIFFDQIAPITSGSNIMSCSIVPSGFTATVLHFRNGWEQVNGQSCSGPSGTVTDNGSSYGANTGNTNTYSAGGVFGSGGFLAQGLTGFYGWTQQDIYGVSTPATTVTASINQTAQGVLSVNTTTVGNGLGEIDAGVVKVAGVAVVPGTHGNSTMVAGTVTVTTSAAVAVSGTHGYDLTHCNASGTLGILSVGTITPGTSFVINSSNVADTSNVCWSIH